jgi:CRISPR system Cascade subunit CasA
MLPAEPFCLLDRPWLPVLRRSGERAWIRPAEITSQIADDPVTAFAWSRADLDVAARELLIGLLSTACWRHVLDEDEWEAWWQAPPDPAVLGACLAPLRDAFILDGPGPRFMQDLEELQAAPVPVAGLLIDTPGENALRKNTDLFVKRGRIEALSRAAAAMAIFTLQDFAPAGGAGHRTSLRGGGPMLTLVLPAEREEPLPLWHGLWLNTWWDEGWPGPEGEQLPRIFPWLARTRTSEAKGAVTTPKDVHPAQALWGMPRRIRLDFAPDEAGRCDLTGQDDPVVVRTYRTRPYGANYVGWQHPLTPYYRTKPADLEWLPRHPQPERLGYRHWVGLIVASKDELRRPAAIVGRAERRLLDLGSRRARLWAAGYDMDNMKPRSFVESEMPLLLVTDQKRHEDYEGAIRELTGMARDAAALLGSTVRQALWGNEAPGSDTGDRYLASERFWARTESRFLEIVASLATSLDAAGEDEERSRTALAEATADWRRALSGRALAIFDELVPLDAIEEQRAMERRIAARRRLFFGLRQPASDGAATPRRRKAA